jgi:tRNA/tmRNA/rRNA uracil-C5-methylase (TrmA/RlmC/RlmD family)
MRPMAAERPPSPPVVRDVDVDRVVPGGAGLAHVDGRVALVDGALPGDRVRAEVSGAGPRLLRGRALEVLTAGPHRRPADEVCPRARDGTCGGCDWPAARLDSHRELKTSLVLDALRRVGGLEGADLPEPGWIGSPRSYRLRNRLHLGRDGRLGFFAPRSRQVSDLETCEIVSDPLRARLPSIGSFLRMFGPVEGELSTLENRDGSLILGELRLGDANGPGALSNVSKGPFDGLRIADADGRLLAEDGPDAVDIVAGGTSFQVSVSSFFQGNRFLLDGFLDEIRTALGAAGPIRKGLDLYAGVGFLTRPLLEAASAAGGEVVAVEVDESSSNDLSGNLRRWASEGLTRARADRATAEAFLSSPALSRNPDAWDVAVADPPRAGLSPVVRKELLRLGPAVLLMVSCDPPTLARDLAALGADYAVRRLTLLDLFPGTHHIETVALLVRRT